MDEQMKKVLERFNKFREEQPITQETAAALTLAVSMTELVQTVDYQVSCIGQEIRNSG